MTTTVMEESTAMIWEYSESRVESQEDEIVVRVEGEGKIQSQIQRQNPAETSSKRTLIWGGFCRICLCIWLCIFCGHFGVISEIQSSNTAQIQRQYSIKTLEIMGLRKRALAGRFMFQLEDEVAGQ